MTAREARNRQFLTDLFAGPFRGHGIIMDPAFSPHADDIGPGDYSIYDRPVADWVPQHLRRYETMREWHEALDDDSVPYVRLGTGTQLFAAAFGCPVAVFDDGVPAFARPLVTSAAEADALRVPSLDAPPLSRVFELGHLLRARVGPEVPVAGPDIQSPFDIAALIWRKEDFFVAMIEEPEAVHRLVAKCYTLLAQFFTEFMRQFPNCNLCHCPQAWAPPELGIWLSEDEAGNMSVPMFEEFCLPTLVRLSEQFGGIFIHCCATADHQYGSFRTVPNLRGLNRVFQAPGPRPAIEAFSGHTVLMQAWQSEDGVNEFLDLALPATRYLFNVSMSSLDEAKAVLDRLRPRCGRA